MQSFLARHSQQSHLPLRIIAASLFALAFLLYRFLYIVAKPECLFDAWHYMTGQLNEGLDKYGRDNVVLGIGQVLEDGWITTVHGAVCNNLDDSRVYGVFPNCFL